MKKPPYLLKLQVENPRHAFSIWFPLFIIGPIIMILAVAVVLIALPFVFISFLFTWESDCRWWFRRVPAVIDMITSLPGLKIDVDDSERHVTIVFQ